MERRENYRKRLVAIEWKLLDTKRALEEARQLSEELAETHSTRLAVHDLYEAVLPELNRAIGHLRCDLEGMKKGR
jgi:hypothetical protein